MRRGSLYFFLTGCADRRFATARWTYITHLIKAYLTFTPPGGKADGRKAHSVSVWLLRQLDPQHHVVKEAGEEVGILVIFLSGTREEEHARRVAELGGPQALAFHPTETKYTFLVHALLQFVDADGIDKLGWTCSVAGKRDDEGRSELFLSSPSRRPR